MDSSCFEIAGQVIEKTETLGEVLNVDCWQGCHRPNQLQIHWFAIINSVVIVVLLAGLLSTLFIRNLRNDIHKYDFEFLS